MRRAPVFLGILLLSLPYGLYSQCYSARSYTASDGMVSSSVYDIIQDLHGVMWFATGGGVSTYDGSRWQNHTQENGFPFQECRYLLSDRSGTVWAFTDEFNEGAARFNPKNKSWTVIRHTLLPDGSHDLLSGAALIENSKSSVSYLGLATSHNGFFILSGQQWTQIPLSSQGNRPSLRLYDTLAWNGAFYLASSNGLYSVTPDTPAGWTRHDLDTPSPEIYSLAVDSHNGDRADRADRMWAAGHDWAGYWRDGRFTVVFNGHFPDNYYSSFSLPEHLASMADPFDGMWLANDRVLLHISESGELKVFNILSPVIADGAYAFLFDEESNLWLGNFRGAHRISHMQFEQYSKRDGLLQDEVTAICGFENGGLVFGHNGGFTFLEKEKILASPFPSVKRKFIFNSRVLSMCRDLKGNIWAAVEMRGVVKVTPNLEMKWHTLSQSQPGQTYNALALGPGGDLWLAAGQSLYTWNNSTQRFHIVPGFSPPIQYIRNLYFDDSGVLWISTGGKGLFTYDGMNPKNTRLTQITSLTERHANSVYAVYRDSSHGVLAGTKAGLFEIVKNHLVRVNRGNLKIDEPVYFIIPEPGRGLWFGTGNGVINWENGRLRHYTTKSGLIGRESNRSAAWFDKSGHLWMGFDLGVSRYMRERELLKRPPPRLELLYLDASGLKLSLDRENHLNPAHDDLTFYFRGISYIDENKLVYTYMLNGFDEHWITRNEEFGNQVRYTNLPPGTYRFYLKVARPSGEGGRVISSPPIYLKTPFHRSMLFYAIIGTGGLLLILISLTYLNKRRHALQLEREVRQRTRQLKESEQEIRYLFDNVHDAILIIEPHTECVLELNNRACEQYGFSRKEFLGMCMKDISENIERGEGMITDTFKNGSIRGVDTIQFRKDGSTMYLEVNASLVNYRGKTTILSINRDITERKKTELRTRQSLEEKTILLQEVHHRVKNNLQIISSLLDLQADSMEDPEVSRLLLENKSRVHSLALLYDNLFHSENLAQIDIDQYIHDIVAYLFGFVVEKGVSYALDVAAVSLEMDRAIPLGLILTELVFNALKHAFPNGRKGKIVVTLRQSGEDIVMLKVWDNGVGLGKKRHIDQTQSLGLQLVSSLTGQLNGRLEIEETNGTSFILTFPNRTSSQMKIKE